jgi:hypothetical protein
MKRLHVAIIGLSLVVCLCGCAPLLLTLGAAGTAAVSLDTIRLERNIEYDKVWQATLDALKQNDASIDSEDKEKGLIKATIEFSNISINVAQIQDRPTAVDITVRRKGLPNLKLADALAEDINAQLKK